MQRWISGPGAVFRRQRDGSTNYLGAYDKAGRLVRASESRAKQRELKARVADPDTATDSAVDAEQEMKELKRAEDEGEGRGRGRRRGMREKGDGKTEKIPPETKEDLQPFPLNPFFRSQSVLSEALRDEVYRRIVAAGQTVREVSQALGITMERVGAVVRLKTIENDWAREGKPHALPYARKTLAMLPQTPHIPSSSNSAPPTAAHETINDLPVHLSTLPQLFHPTSATRHFTRADAGLVFSRSLKPADERIPHPDMIATECEKSAGLSFGEREARKKGRWEAEIEEGKEVRRRALEKERSGMKVVKGERWDFRIRAVEGGGVGVGGRGDAGVGWRYGAPLEDRKKGLIKIPTSVDS